MLTLQKFKMNPFQRCRVFQDFHVGNVSARRDKLEDTVESILNDDAKAIIPGDLLDMVMADDKRYDVDAVDPELNKVTTCVEYLMDILWPIRDQILGIGIGNHEGLCKNIGHNVIAEMCGRRTVGQGGRDYGLGCAYLGNQTYVEFSIGKHKSHIFVTHPFKWTCSTRQSRLNKARQTLHDRSEVIDSDYKYRSIQGICVAHTHDCCISYEQTKVVADFKNIDTPHRHQFIALTGGFLESGQINKEDYASKANLAPLPPGYVDLIFDKERLCEAKAILLDTPLAY